MTSVLEDLISMIKNNILGKTLKGFGKKNE